MIKEFKNFITRGNVIDLAVAVIIGGAFTAIVNALVNDIIMPLVGIILGGLDFSKLTLKVGDAVLTYGNFLQAIVTFFIIAFVLFLIVKAVNKASTKKDEVAGPSEIDLLTEIRDALRGK